jgi:hypothetical protein
MLPPLLVNTHAVFQLLDFGHGAVGEQQSAFFLDRGDDAA